MSAKSQSPTRCKNILENRSASQGCFAKINSRGELIRGEANSRGASPSTNERGEWPSGPAISLLRRPSEGTLN